jgi:OOP family OmpA-OmpF porin
MLIGKPRRNDAVLQAVKNRAVTQFREVQMVKASNLTGLMGVVVAAGMASLPAYSQDAVTESNTAYGSEPSEPVAATPTSSLSGGEHDYIAALGTYVYPDKDRGVTARGYSGYLIYGHLFTDDISLEFAPFITVFEHGKGKGTDYYEEGGSIDLAYAPLGRNQHTFNPFLLAGIGGSHEEVLPASGKKETVLADAGAGFVTKPLFYGVAIRAEARYLYDAYHEFRGSGYGDIRGSVGIEIPLGLVEHSVVAAPEPVKIVDTKEVARPWIDTDGDGVDDEHDKCPGTPHGLKVDSDGCVIPGQVIVLRGVTFEFNKTRITPNAESVLDGVLPAFTGQPNLHVEIAGHTDSIGSVAYNLKLSQGRADSVRNYLISKGALPEQLRAVGYGKSQLLINPEKNDDDRELNRRVEFRVVDK